MRWMIAAGVIGLCAIAAGAFAAHGLEGRVSERALAALHTGANYALLHAIALLAIAALMEKSPRHLKIAGWLFVGGVMAFSGSLIIYGVTGITGHLWITPLGGLALMLGWGFVAWAGYKATE